MSTKDERTGSYALKGGMPVEVRNRLTAQHERFGGISWGAAFFGWLCANGLAILLLALLSAGGVALGLTTSSTDTVQQAQDAVNGQIDKAGAIGIGGGIAVLIVLALAYFCGGYVAGRMSRFDGARQGIAVWIIGLVVVIALAVLAAVFGAKYNILSRLNLPRIPIDEGSATTGGVIALIAVVIITALAAVLGGKAGERYHRRIDRVGLHI
jgi:hypothetical protein